MNDTQNKDRPKELQTAITRLAEICSTLPTILKEIPEEEFIYTSSPAKWSKKQILGHLVDSAANNHQRFVRIQYEQEPIIFYDQNEWNRIQEYNRENTGQLIQLWELYNLHLLHIVKNIRFENLGRMGILRSGEKFSLEWYIIDYVTHLEHHLHQITPY